MKVEKEVKQVIAKRVPPGDRWQLVDSKTTCDSLTETLEAYFQKTEYKGDFGLAPLKGELYIWATEIEEIKPEPPKKYSLYGDRD